MNISLAIKILEDYFKGVFNDNTYQNMLIFAPNQEFNYNLINQKINYIRKERYGNYADLSNTELIIKAIDAIAWYLNTVQSNIVTKQIKNMLEEHTSDMLSMTYNFVLGIISDNFLSLDKEYRKVKMFRLLPYRRLYNIGIDNYLYQRLSPEFKKYVNDNLLDYSESPLFTLIYFIDQLPMFEEEIKHKLKNKIYFFLEENNLNCNYNWNTNWKVSPKKEYPSEQIILNNMSNTISYPYNNDLLGAYGELQLYNLFKENMELFGDVIWVSNEIGDGFGYDLMTVSNDGKLSKTFEVKTTMNPCNLDNFYLSKNEFEKYKAINTSVSNSSSYYIYNYLVNQGGIIKTHVFHKDETGQDVMIDVDNDMLYEVEIADSYTQPFIRRIKR